MLEQRANPDDICTALKFCTDPSCRLFGRSAFSEHSESKFSLSSAQSSKLSRDLKEMLGVSEKSETLENAKSFAAPITGMPPFHKVLPFSDNDGDYFSTIPTLRGYNWRGQDCNDFDSTVYPGRRIPSGSVGTDYNCNGISGTDPSSGKAWKDVYCSNSGQLGVAVMGGSACSHFAIRDKWVRFSNISSSTYSDVIQAAENELDWPHKSWVTGYDTWSDEGPIHSIYLKMRERNLCNHRDYQQLGVNGYDSLDVLAAVESLARNRTHDHPMLLVHAPIGDDVCNMHNEDTVSYMTTPEEFRIWVHATLKKLDDMLPPNSHVLFVGLVNGSILWDTLHNRMHPFGVTYPQLYTWLLCLKSNPCVGWLNPDAKTRHETTQRAQLLSDQYPIIIEQHKHEFKNFDLAYYPFPLKPILDKWVADGNDPALLIEPVDGFHPSTIANSLVAKWLTDHLEKDHPEFLGPINPNNAAIKAKFGAQGGY